MGSALTDVVALFYVRLVITPFLRTLMIVLLHPDLEVLGLVGPFWSCFLGWYFSMTTENISKITRHVCGYF